MFFVLHTVSANNLDSDIISLVTFYVGLIFYVIFNVVKPKKSILLVGFYIVPTVISSLSFFLGDYQLGTHTT